MKFEPSPIIVLIDETAAIYGVKGENIRSGGRLSNYETRVRKEAAKAVRSRWPSLKVKTLAHAFKCMPKTVMCRKSKIEILPQRDPNAVLREFCAENLVGLRDILDRSRYPHLIAARHKAVRHVAATCPQLSLPELARIFDRDHTSIMNALGRLKRSRGKA